MGLNSDLLATLFSLLTFPVYTVYCDCRNSSYIQVGAQCYYVKERYSSGDIEAYKTCDPEYGNSHLPEFSNKDDFIAFAHFLNQQFGQNKTYEKVWFGIKPRPDKSTSNSLKWEWIRGGMSPDVSIWADGQPDRIPLASKCATIAFNSKTARWEVSDVSCEDGAGTRTVCQMESFVPTTTTTTLAPSTTITSTTTTTTVTTSTTTTTTTTTIKTTTATVRTRRSFLDRYTALEATVILGTQSVGCTGLIGLLVVTIVAGFLVRDFSIERKLQLAEEIALLVAHVVMLTAGLQPCNEHRMGVCMFVNAFINYTFLFIFLMLLFQTIQSFNVLSNMISTGAFWTNWKIVAMSIFLPLAPVIACFPCMTGVDRHWAVFQYTYPWIVFIPTLGLGIAAILINEVAGMITLKPTPATPLYKRAANYTNQKFLYWIVIFHIASWCLCSVAISQDYVILFPIIMWFNIILGVVIFNSHVLANPKMRRIFKHMLYSVRNCLCCGKYPWDPESVMILNRKYSGGAVRRFSARDLNKQKRKRWLSRY